MAEPKQKNCIFIWIPKNAGTSVAATLGLYAGMNMHTDTSVANFTNSGAVTFGHMDIRSLRQSGIISDEFYHDAFKFAIVRNPYTRLVSLYLYFLSLHYNFSDGRGYKEIKKGMTFTGFCKFLKESSIPPVGEYNINGLSQANPQYDWIRNNANFIGRYENLKWSWGVICKKTGIENNKLAKLNKSVKKIPWRNHYTPFCKNFCKSFYEVDFKVFGYDMDFI